MCRSGKGGPGSTLAMKFADYGGKQAAEAWLGGRRRPCYRSAPSVLLKTDGHASDPIQCKREQRRRRAIVSGIVAKRDMLEMAVSAAALALSIIDSNDDDEDSSPWIEL